MMYQLLISLSFNEHIVPIVTMVSTLGLFILGILTYFSFIKNRLSQKQLDIVSETIKLIHNASVDFSFLYMQGRGAHGRAVSANLFEIKSIYDPNNEIVEFESEPVIFSHNSNQIENFVRIINNPITPKVIADELIKFHCSSYEIIDIEQFGEEQHKYVVMDTTCFQPNRQMREPHNGASYYKGNAFATNTWLNFKESCLTLEKVITDWLKLKGINDINIRTEDFKTTFELPRQD